MSNVDRLIIATQIQRIIELSQENVSLKNELAARDETIKNLSGGVQFDDAIEKLHYDHWVDKTLKINPKRF